MRVNSQTSGKSEERRAKSRGQRAEGRDQFAAAALARARRLQAARIAFISARSTTIRVATPLYFFVVPVTVRLTAPWFTRPCSFSYARKRSISSPPLAAFRSRRLRSIISNKGLNSKEAFDESTATSSSVMLSGIRRVKEIPRFLAIKDYRRNRGNSDRSRLVSDRFSQRSRSRFFEYIQSNSANCSFVKPASRINARSVPLANSRWFGTVAVVLTGGAG